MNNFVESIFAYLPEISLLLTLLLVFAIIIIFYERAKVKQANKSADSMEIKFNLLHGISSTENMRLSFDLLNQIRDNEVEEIGEQLKYFFRNKFMKGGNCRSIGKLLAGFRSERKKKVVMQYFEAALDLIAPNDLASFLYNSVLDGILLSDATKEKDWHTSGKLYICTYICNLGEDQRKGLIGEFQSLAHEALNGKVSSSLKAEAYDILRRIEC